MPAHGQESLRDAAKRLRAAVAAEEARIADTREGLADAERRLAVLDARARKRRQQLFDTQDKLVKARVRLTRLEQQAGDGPRSCSPRTCARATWTASRASSPS